METRQFSDINERLDYIEFRQELLLDADDVSRILLAYKITRKEYSNIMNLMDVYRNKIDARQPVYRADFESEIYRIAPIVNGDYHFCEQLTLAFYEERRWEEVFISLYGNEKKFEYLKGKK